MRSGRCESLAKQGKLWCRSQVVEGNQAFGKVQSEIGELKSEHQQGNAILTSDVGKLVFEIVLLPTWRWQESSRCQLQHRTGQQRLQHFERKRRTLTSESSTYNSTTPSCALEAAPLRTIPGGAKEASKPRSNRILFQRLHGREGHRYVV